MSRGLLTASQLASMQATVVSNFDQTATRRRFPLITDRYNDQIRDTAHPQDVTGIRVGLLTVGEREIREDRDAQIADLIARLPAGTDITGRDVLVIGGKTYEVIGPIVDWGTHLDAKLKLVEG